jgi:hypothetical protein
VSGGHGMDESGADCPLRNHDGAPVLGGLVRISGDHDSGTSLSPFIRICRHRDLFHGVFLLCSIPKFLSAGHVPTVPLFPVGGVYGSAAQYIRICCRAPGREHWEHPRFLGRWRQRIRNRPGTAVGTSGNRCHAFLRYLHSRRSPRRSR